LQTSTLGFAPGGNTELNLSRSNVKLNILNPNGDSASNVDFSFQNDSSQILKSYQFLRPGPVGIYISRTSIGTKYYLQVGNQTGQQKNQLTIFVVDDPNSSTLQLTDLMTGDLFPQDANGVLSVTLKALVLIEGQLLSSSGTQLIIPSSAIVHVGLELIESTTANWKGICQDSQADSAGNWSLVVDRLPAGKYQIQYWVDGSSAIPSFLGSYIWIDSQGKVSSQAATGFTTLVTVNQNIPAKPNLILQMTLPDGSSVDSGTVQIYSEKFTLGWGIQTKSSPTLSFLLPDGTYQLDFYPINSSDRVLGQYSVVIVNSTASMQDIQGNVVAPESDGSFKIHGIATNVLFHIGSPGNSGLGVVAGVSVSPNKNCVTNCSFNTGTSSSSSGSGSLAVPTGDFIITVYAGIYGSVTYNVKNSAGVISITNSRGDPVLKTNGIFELTLPPLNFNFQIVSPQDTNTPVPKLQMNFSSKDSSNNSNFIFATSGASGTGALSVPDGTWSLVVNPSNSGSFVSKTYTLVFSNGAMTSITPSPVSSVGGVYKLTPGNPDIGGRILDPSGALVTAGPGQGFSLNIQSRDSNGNWMWTSTSTWNTNGLWGFVLPTTPGVYRVLVTPNGFPRYTPSVSPEITVAPDGSKSVAGGRSLLGLDISLLTPNLNLKITNPLNGYLMTSGYVEIISSTGNNSYANINLNDQNPGLAWFHLDDGSYTIQVDPPGGIQGIPGIDFDRYDLTMSAGVATIRHGSSNIAADGNGIFTLSPSLANIIGRILDSSGNPVGPFINDQNNWAWMQIQQLSSTGAWINQNAGTSTIQGGYFSIHYITPGTYRLVINPQNVPNGVLTYSNNFQITSDLTGPGAINLGDIRLFAPNLSIKVRIPGGNSDLPNINIQLIDTSGNVSTNSWTTQTGAAAFNVTTPGTYTLTIYPTQETLALGYCKKTYTVNVTSVAGIVTASVQGISAINGVTTLTLATATLKGHVLGISPSTAGVQGATVYARNSATGQTLWEYGTSTDQNGFWAMALPQGTYSIYANGPYQSLTLGNSNILGVVTVDANGVAASLPAGTAADSFNINLNPPTWSGVVKGPVGVVGDPVLSNVTVCINIVISNAGYGSCTQSDSLGRWAISAPVGFSSFDQSSNLQIYQNGSSNYARINVQGSSAITSLGLNAGGNSGILIRLPSTNTSITVTAGGQPTGNLSVNITSIDGLWLGSTNTDSNGVARFYLSDLTHGFDVSVDNKGNAATATAYAPIRQEYSDATVSAQRGTNSGNFAATIALPTPNLKAIIHDPYTGTVSANTWGYLLDSTTKQWVTSFNSDANGFISLYIPGSISGSTTYQLYIYPQSNDVSLSSPQTYSVTISPSGTIVSLNLLSGSVASTETYNGDSVFTLLLAAPTVIGQVKNSAGYPVQGSNVQPQPLDVPYYQNGASSNQAGNFGLSLADGHYSVQASPPWMDSTESNSAPCLVTVASGQVANAAGGCIQNNKTIALGLRSSNLTLTFTDATGAPLQGAWIGISGPGWWSTSSTNSAGVASFFVDIANMKANNPGISGLQNLYLSINPGINGPNAVNTNCFSGQLNSPCANLPQLDFGATDFLATSVSVHMLAPNLKISVLNIDGTPAGTNSYVQLYGFDQKLNKIWLGCTWTDATGSTYFNVDTSTFTSFGIHVEPGSSQTAAGIDYDNNGAGYSLADINNHSFRLGQPNLTLIAIGKNSSGNSRNNSWGWFNVIQIDPITHNDVKWIAGLGFDQSGSHTLFLPPSSSYRIRIYPGPYVVGAETDCLVTTNSSGVVSLVADQCGVSTLNGATLSVNLSAGNVYGTVTDKSGNPVANAIVYAQVVTGGTEKTAVVGTTDSSGNYGLSLNNMTSYTISIIPFNDSNSGVQLLRSTSDPFTVTSLSPGAIRKDFQLGTK
jgi:hypothetical protein